MDDDQKPELLDAEKPASEGNRYLGGYRKPQLATVAVLPADELRKKCERCEFEKFPEEGFDRDVKQADGFARICKTCMAEIAREEHLEQIAARVRTLDRASLKVLEMLGGLKPREIVSAPHVVSLLQDLTHVWGGTQGFAQHLMAQFLAAPAGGMMRQKCLEMYAHLVKIASEANYAKKPLHAMNDEELQAEAKRRLTPSMRKALMLRLGMSESDDEQTNLPYSGGSAAG